MDYVSVFLKIVSDSTYEAGKTVWRRQKVVYPVSFPASCQNTEWISVVINQECLGHEPTEQYSEVAIRDLYWYI